MKALAAAGMSLALAAPIATAAPTTYTLTAPLVAQRGSGENGSVTLTPITAASTRVTISVTGEPSGASQPAHIHVGTCARLDPHPKWGLNDVEEGASVTVVPVGIKTLTADDYVVNMHLSSTAIMHYVACSELSTAKRL
ncbi:MAG TPA: hypothetical protein VKT51_06565 [Candidatus Eremiobacteraceae bacterium]|nr:hypothetical protein [Candidatus Eremiobacteraceae bacterium]